LRATPGLAAARNNLALTYAAGGDLARAAQEFSTASPPGAADYNMGIVHLAQGEHRLAAEAFERAILARPSFSAAKARAHAARFHIIAGRQVRTVR
jgi:Tfp pilus assembly protein PilF